MFPLRIGGLMAAVLKRKDDVLAEKFEKFRVKLKELKDTWEVALVLIMAVVIFFAGQWYGASHNITKAEIKKIVSQAEDRLTAQIQRNRLRIDEQDLTTVESESIQTENIENVFQIQE